MSASAATVPRSARPVKAAVSAGAVRLTLWTQSIRLLFLIGSFELLIELGHLLGDITPMNVHQKHREPTGWRWAEDGPPIEFEISEPEARNGPIGLILGVSATIDPGRVKKVLGPEASIWVIQARNPHNDILRRSDDLTRFRQLMRSVYDRIKAHHPGCDLIHVFPALPVSAAVEVGRTRMPKADLPLEIYDENRAEGGFMRALRVD